MSFIKRAILAVSRRFSRSIIIFIVLLAIANMVFAGFAINTATEKASKLAKEKLGATITISYNMKNALSAARDNQNEEGERERGKFNISGGTLDAAVADEIGTLDNIIGSNYIVTANAGAVDFEIVELSSESGTSSASSSTQPQDDGRGGPLLQFGEGGRNFYMVMPDISVVGVKSTELYSDFTGGTSTLIADSEGNESSHITAEDVGKHYAIIEYNLATENDLVIGDTITLEPGSMGIRIEEEGEEEEETDTSKQVTFTVAGIFEDSSETGDTMQGMNFSSAYNKIYTDYESANSLVYVTNEEGEEVQSTGISTAIYYVNLPENVDALAEEIKALESFDADTYSVDTNDTAYQEMIKPIEGVGTFAKTALVVVAIAGAIILMLILMLFIKERTHETGVLMSMGESRIKIILQYMTEVLIIAIVAFSISIVSGRFIAQGIGDVLISQEIETLQSDSFESLEGNMGMPDGMGGGSDNMGGAPSDMGGARGPMSILNSKNTDYIDDIEVTVSLNDIVLTYAAGFAIILVGIAVPALSIMRFKPKKILSKMS